MLGQRRRRWSNINPVMGQILVFAGSVTPKVQITSMYAFILSFFLFLLSETKICKKGEY